MLASARSCSSVPPTPPLTLLSPLGHSPKCSPLLTATSIPAALTPTLLPEFAPLSPVPSYSSYPCHCCRAPPTPQVPISFPTLTKVAHDLPPGYPAPHTVTPSLLHFPPVLAPTKPPWYPLPCCHPFLLPSLLMQSSQAGHGPGAAVGRAIASGPRPLPGHLSVLLAGPSVPQRPVGQTPPV